MKILHTADWHLGKKLDNYSRIQEQREVMNEICSIADSHNVDMVLIAGDLFDSFNPSTESVELFYKTLKKLSKDGSRAVIAISGNHDSPDRIETPNPLALECGIVFIGYPNTQIKPFKLDSEVEIINSEPGFVEVKMPNVPYSVRVVSTPYANEHRLKVALNSENKEDDLRNILQSNWKRLCDKYCDDKGVNVLVSHLFMINKDEKIIPEEPDNEKPILFVGGAQPIYTSNIPDNIQYTALGHLHRKQQIPSDNGTVMYSGSPIAYSFAEAHQKKYVIIVDAQPGKEVTINQEQLHCGKNLVRITAKGIADAETKLLENIDSLVELTLITEDFISANDRQHLNDIHPNIINLLPQIKNKGQEDNENYSVDINKSLEDLFADYFEHSYEKRPDDDIKNLFNEIISL